jgi:hypothetical protein
MVISDEDIQLSLRLSPLHTLSLFPGPHPSLSPLYRNPALDHNRRPNFDSIHDYFYSPEESLLQWQQADKIPGKQAHVLGAILSEANDLYLDLHRTYQKPPPFTKKDLIKTSIIYIHTITSSHLYVTSIVLLCLISLLHSFSG